MKPGYYSFFSAFLIGAMVIAGCKKQQDTMVDNPPVSSTNPVNQANQVLDSTLLLTRDLYLWYHQVPSNLNARSYADPIKIMEAIRQYSTEPGYPLPVDKWSFAIKKKDWDNQSNGIVMTNTDNGVQGDFGMIVFFRAEGDLRVRAVEEASPAGRAGIRRSWRVIKINGNTNLTTANSSFITQNIYSSSNTAFTFKRPDGTSVDINLNTATYKTQPVYLDTLYHISNKRIGYMVFNSFLGDTNQIYNQFRQVFSKFSSGSITDVVIDLRYNGGGYVSVQEKLADLLVSASANNGLMFKEQFNNKNSRFNSEINFRKSGTLNLDHIYFIVSNSTASASELLINNLKPYMDVRLVGPGNTYGKPVGFFPVSVGDWYVFPVSFRAVNKDGIGNYFGGLQVNSRVADGLDKDWGDVKESCLANVLKHITTGTYMARASGLPVDLPDEVKNSNEELDAPLFKGAVGNNVTVRN